MTESQLIPDYDPLRGYQFPSTQHPEQRSPSDMKQDQGWVRRRHVWRRGRQSSNIRKIESNANAFLIPSSVQIYSDGILTTEEVAGSIILIFTKEEIEAQKIPYLPKFIKLVNAKAGTQTQAVKPNSTLLSTALFIPKGGR